MTLSSYATTAYSPANLHRQPPGKSRSGLKRLTGQRLPWGNTQEVVPDSFMTPGPSSLRHLESVRLKRDQELAQGTYKPAPLEHIDFHDRCDHEHYRHAPWSTRTHFWIYVASFGKVGFFIFLVIGLITALQVGFVSQTGFITGFWESVKTLALVLLLPCLVFWGLASLVIHKLPRLWAKPGKGPKWELNRRTGMITVFKYKGKEATEHRALFPEFDAYINTTPDRQGLPMNVLSLEHRYSDISIHFGDIQPPDRTINQPLALWDFIQNYMDTSHPLPDAPLFEEHRHNDPTTVEHDKAKGRNPRYWINMDDETFKKAKHEMLGRVDRINTLTRPNLMAQFVEYN
ncbi:hypothetical protein [Halopseudomonas pelagia]|uniref:hypothetical protein n=1 Tax=Halopseudomonas pelagia TaxID=553151 RepID=UPI0003A31245|nr:hypothetical protein [Halopseudomonas pelagia]|tara:strand:+ start:5450 stop:6484 length:1035 start_codon:yes stop_codon:yes gene_type:complete